VHCTTLYSLDLVDIVLHAVIPHVLKLVSHQRLITLLTDVAWIGRKVPPGKIQGVGGFLCCCVDVVIP